MQKTAFGHPVFYLDQDAVHHRDLPRRAAKAQHGNPQPDPKGLAECNSMTELPVRDFLACWDIRHFNPVFPHIGGDLRSWSRFISFGTTSFRSDIRFCTSVRHSFSSMPAADLRPPCYCSTAPNLPGRSRSISKAP